MLNTLCKRKNMMLFMIAILSIRIISAQSVISPNYALKSHETLEISKVELSDEHTTVYLTIENRIEGGSFCADKIIYMLCPDGRKIFMDKSSGIPTCPDSHIFKTIGEKLDFILYFPALPQGTRWIDLIEDCSSNCFWFYGVTLDNNLNNSVNEAFSQAVLADPEDNLRIFTNLLVRIDNENTGIEGLLYINIITVAIENGDIVNARVWYRRLVSSGAPRVKEYIRYLNNKGIKY